MPTNELYRPKKSLALGPSTEEWIRKWNREQRESAKGSDSSSSAEVDHNPNDKEINK